MRCYWFSVLSFLTAVPLADFKTPLLHRWDDMLVKHTLYDVPANWESLGHPHPGTTIDLYIALMPDREGALIDALHEVSEPTHPRYGAHLSKEQVADLVKPRPESLELISAWLVHHGVRSSSISVTLNGAWLTVTDVLVSQANQLLGASYQFYRHAKTDEIIIRTVGYALPTVLHPHIQVVTPATHFASTQVKRQTPRRRSFGAAAAQAASGKLGNVLSTRDGEVMPSYLHWLYKTSTYIPVATDQNKLAVLGFKNQFPSQADLNDFVAQFYTDAKGATFTVKLVNGGKNDPNDPGFEASADIQYTEAMAYPTPITFYSIGGKPKWSPSSKKPVRGDVYIEWFIGMFTDPNIPQTVSISYGGPEQSVPYEYAKAVCLLFAQLGARGVSVLTASGDDGVGPPEECDNGEGVSFVPEFPSSCPYVTSVGGTTGGTTGSTTGQDPEVAASLSGGGFSFYFDLPKYQQIAVPKYLKQLGTNYAGAYNPEGRAYPDIAAQALDFVVVVNNAARVMSGTSLATPTVAGIISLLNDFLISKRKPPLGFLNPLLYGKGLAGFNDIQSGSNPGCETEGFPAVTGWDPVTGLGTPNFQKLLKILIALHKIDL